LENFHVFVVVILVDFTAAIVGLRMVLVQFS